MIQATIRMNSLLCFATKGPVGPDRNRVFFTIVSIAMDPAARPTYSITPSDSNRDTSAADMPNQSLATDLLDSPKTSERL